MHSPRVVDWLPLRVHPPALLAQPEPTTETFAPKDAPKVYLDIFGIYTQSFHKHKSSNAQFRAGKNGNRDMVSPSKPFDTVKNL